MGEAFLVQKYSMPSDTCFAVINIVYTEGSTCTCTNGNATLIPPDMSGSWLCIIPEAGTWTISCGSDNKTVEINSEGQYVNVVFSSELYAAGDDGSNWITAIGSGVGGSGDVVWNTDNVYILGGYHSTSGAGYYSGISTSVDFTGVNTIKVNVSSLSGKGGAYVAVTDAPLSSSSGAPTFTTFASLDLSSGENILDVSHLTGVRYLVIYAHGNNGRLYCYITNISIN